MKIINLCCCGEGYYSGQTYEENIAIFEDTFDKIKEDIDSMKVCLGELDGKHSCVYGEVEIQTFTEDEIPNAGFDEIKKDGDCLYNKLEDVFQLHHLSLNDEIERVNDYLETLDLFVDFTINLKQSDIEKVKIFLEILGY